MNTRGITILGLLQVLLVFGLILSTTAMFRTLTHISSLPPPPIYELISHYGIFLLVIPFTWIIASTYVAISPKTTIVGISISGIIGGGICIFFILLIGTLILQPFAPTTYTIDTTSIPKKTEQDAAANP